MKRYIFMLLLISSIVKAQDKYLRYTAIVSSCKLNWTGHAQTGAYSPEGTIRLKSGEIALRKGQLLSAIIIVDMKTLSHDNADLQNHLRDKDFFDVIRYPQAKFTLRSVKANMATGVVEIKGIKKQVSFPFTLTSSANGMLLKARISIDRTQFGIKYNSASYFQDLGSYAIKNEFELNIECDFSPG